MKKTKELLLILALSCVRQQTGAAQAMMEPTPVPWGVVRPAGGRCSALMPVPSRESALLAPGNTSDETGGSYHLSFDDGGDVKPENLKTITLFVTQKVSDKVPLPRTFRYKGYPAVEYQMESNSGKHMVLRFVLVHDRLYEMSYTAPAAFFDPGRAYKFLDSLVILEPELDDLREGRIDSIEIRDYGLYTVGKGPQVQGLNPDHQSVHLIGGYHLDSQTSLIKAKIGESFGFTFVPVGEPTGGQVRLRFVYLFPPGGLKNPATGETSRQLEYVSSQLIGEESHASYGFDHYWELVPGDWTIQIWKDDRKLAEKTFRVEKP